MRFDTINAANYFVWQLQNTGKVRDIQDDGDLIYIELATRDKLLVYLVERPMPLSDVQHHIQTNSQKDLHTLFIFWIDMLLPGDGTLYDIEDWMQAVMSLHNDKIYGFEVAGQEAYFLPIHFEGRSYRRRVRYGRTVDFNQLNCRRINTDNSHLRGTWRVADFQPYSKQRRTTHHPLVERDPKIMVHFEILGINITEDKTLIKAAYHKLARQYHPDVDKTGKGAQKMKRINNAYAHVMRLINGD